MNHFLTLTLVALATFNTLFAQSGKQVQDLPQLEEWFSMSSGYGISYLPNFDVANGGINATALNLRGTATIYNRFQGDTVNQFSWERASLVVYGDFNNDGLRDYVDVGGRLYLGVGANTPPKQTGKKILDRDLWYEHQGTVVKDFTGDGIDDIITRGKSVPDSAEQDGYLIMGNADTSRIRSLSFKFPGTQRSVMVAAYAVGGQGRVISYGYGTGPLSNYEGFYLWSAEMETTGEPAVKLALLDKVERFMPSGAQPFYSYYDFMLYFTVSESPIAVLLSFTDDPKAYTLTNDKWGIPQTLPQKVGEPFYMSSSIDNDSLPDWVATVSQAQRAVFSGDPNGLCVPRAIFPRLSCGGSAIARAIGDVSGDGIGDFATAFRDGCFRIYKGIDWQAVGVAEQQSVSFSMSQSEPNPVAASGQGVVSVSVRKAGRYTLMLYSLNGNEVARVFAEELSPGEHRFVIEPKRFGLAPGLYNLRLSDGVRTRERGFLVEGR